MLPFPLVVISMYLIITHSLPTSVEKYPGFKNGCVTFSTTAQNVVLLSLIEGTSGMPRFFYISVSEGLAQELYITQLCEYTHTSIS